MVQSLTFVTQYSKYMKLMRRFSLSFVCWTREEACILVKCVLGRNEKVQKLVNRKSGNPIFQKLPTMYNFGNYQTVVDCKQKHIY